MGRGACGYCSLIRGLVAIKVVTLGCDEGSGGVTVMIGRPALFRCRLCFLRYCNKTGHGTARASYLPAKTNSLKISQQLTMEEERRQAMFASFRAGRSPKEVIDFFQLPQVDRLRPVEGLELFHRE